MFFSGRSKRERGGACARALYDVCAVVRPVAGACLHRTRGSLRVWRARNERTDSLVARLVASLASKSVLLRDALSVGQAVPQRDGPAHTTEADCPDMSDA